MKSFTPYGSTEPLNLDKKQRWDREFSFCKTRDPRGELSNMCAGFPMFYGGISWKSSEALYQAARFQDRPDIWEQINNASNGFTAKQKAYEFKEMTRPDWQDIKIDVMLAVTSIKWSQHRARLQPIVSACTGPIVELSKKDDFWGAIPGERFDLIGANILGQLWTLLGKNAIRNYRIDVLPCVMRTLDDVIADPNFKF